MRRPVSFGRAPAGVSFIWIRLIAGVLRPLFWSRCSSNALAVCFDASAIEVYPSLTDSSFAAQTILAGTKARGGIVCGCCSSTVSPSTFEQHAGKGARRNPYTSIFVDSADIHLKDYAQRVEAQGGPSRGEPEAEECAECGDGGNLILCDGCPKGYHPECVRSVAR